VHGNQVGLADPHTEASARVKWAPGVSAGRAARPGLCYLGTAMPHGSGGDGQAADETKRLLSRPRGRGTGRAPTWDVPIGWTPSTTATDFYASRETETGGDEKKEKKKRGRLSSLSAAL